MSHSARSVFSRRIIRVSLPISIRPIHSLGLAIVVTLLAAWAHASQQANRAAQDLANCDKLATIMIPVDEQLQPLGELIEIEGQRYVAVPIEKSLPVASTYGAGAPWESTGLPHPSSFVALCASVCFWLQKKRG